MKKFFDQEHSVTIAPATIVFAVFFVLGLFFLYFIREIVITFFMSVILMSALHPAVRGMKRRLHLPKVLGILIMYVLVISFVVTAFLVIVPPLVSEVPNLINSLNLPPLPEHIRDFNFTAAELNSALTQLQSSFAAIFGVLSSTLRGVLALFTILVLSAYLLLDRDNLHKKIVWMTNNPKHIQMAKDFVDSLEVQLGGWVRGEAVLMLTIGVLTFIGLTILGVPYALPLALAAGLFEMLPNLGPTLSAIPALIVAYTAGGWQMVAVVLILYIAIQQLENHFIVPKVMKENVDVSPLITILVILIGFKVASMSGALLAVPSYIFLRTVYAFWVKSNATEVA